MLEIAGELRRHVAHPSLSRHPFRQRPAHLRLSLQAMDQARRSRRRPRSCTTWARSSTRTTSPRTSATATRSLSATLVEHATTSGRSRRTRTDTGEPVRFTANFLWMCQGYYRHSEGYTPHWDGMENFKGQIVHPQTWPEDLDYKGKNVVVIGSGATAATLIPAIATDCGHVTMLQRSPTYFRTGRNADRARRGAARTADRRDVDPRDRAPQDPARPGRLHPPHVRANRRR